MSVRCRSVVVDDRRAGKGSIISQTKKISLTLAILIFVEHMQQSTLLTQNRSSVDVQTSCWLIVGATWGPPSATAWGALCRLGGTCRWSLELSTISGAVERLWCGFLLTAASILAVDEPMAAVVGNNLERWRADLSLAVVFVLYLCFSPTIWIVVAWAIRSCSGA